MLEAKSMLPPGASLSSSSRQAIMQKHAQVYQDLSSDEKLALQHRANVLSTLKTEQKQETLAHLQAEVDLAKQRSSSSSSSSSQLLANCKFDQHDLHQLQSIYDSAEFGAAKVSELRSRITSGPKPTPHHIMGAMSAISVTTSKSSSSWRFLSDICWSRDALGDTAFCVESTGAPGQQHWFKFVYATQNPYHLCVMPLQRCLADPVIADDFELTDAGVPPHDYYFEFDLLDFKFHWDLHDGDVVLVKVLPLVVFLGGRRLGSSADLVALADFTRAHKTKKKGDKTSRGKIPKLQDSDLGEDTGRLAWLDEYLHPGPASRQCNTKSSKRARESEAVTHTAASSSQQPGASSSAPRTSD